jgi:hypothetical protein
MFKFIGRDEPVRVVIQICMKPTQGNSLNSYLYLKLAKLSSFSFFKKKCMYAKLIIMKKNK